MHASTVKTNVKILKPVDKPHHRKVLFSKLQPVSDGLLPVYDAVELVRACEEMPLSYGAFQQNDAAEFLMLLAAHLEEALKGTAHAALLSQCFGGKMVNQVIWDEGGARKVSEREEDFVQIELQVKGHESIERALDTMILGEMLEGDNAYQIEGGGKVDAQMRKCLGELPRIGDGDAALDGESPLLRRRPSNHVGVWSEMGSRCNAIHFADVHGRPGDAAVLRRQNDGCPVADCASHFGLQADHEAG